MKRNRTLVKKFSIVFIVFVLVFGLCACSKDDNRESDKPDAGNPTESTAENPMGNTSSTEIKPGEDPDQNATTGTSTTAPIINGNVEIEDKPYLLPASATVDDYKNAALQLKNYHLDIDQKYKAFTDSVEAARDNGADALDRGMTILAEYFFNYSGASVTAVRNAIDVILAKKNIVPDSEAGFTEWNDIFSISYVNPAAYHMYSLSEKALGNTDKANELSELEELNEDNMPEGIALFDNLAELSDNELLNLREKLVAYEDYIYEISPVAPTGWEACGYEFMEEFYMAALQYCALTQDYTGALGYSLGLLRVNPLDTAAYKLAAVNAMQIKDYETAWYVIESSLPLDETGEMFTLGASLWTALDSKEIAQDLIEVALSLNISSEDKETCEQLQKMMKEGK